MGDFAINERSLAGKLAQAACSVFMHDSDPEINAECNHSYRQAERRFESIIKSHKATPPVPDSTEAQAVQGGEVELPRDWLVSMSEGDDRVYRTAEAAIRAVHDGMCSCGEEPSRCNTEGITVACLQAATAMGESGEWAEDYEDGWIKVAALARQAAPIQPVPEDGRFCYCDSERCHMNGGRLQPGFVCKVLSLAPQKPEGDR